MSTTAERRPPPPRRSNPAAASSEPQPASTSDAFAVTHGKVKGPQRIVIYGPGGIGKTTLASLAPKPLIVDLEMGSRELDVPRVDSGQVPNWESLRRIARSHEAFNPFDTVVFDSATRAELLAADYALRTIPHDKTGEFVKGIEMYGYGKGFQHKFDLVFSWLGDLDRLIAANKSVVLITHDVVDDAPNPGGENWIRYEMSLQTSRSGKASIRNLVFQWADYVLYVGYDVAVRNNRGMGEGTRTIYGAERPAFKAKAKVAFDPLTFESVTDDRIWAHIFGYTSTYQGEGA